MPSTPISITLPQELLDQIKTEVEKGSYASVSEFMRDAVRDKFKVPADATSRSNNHLSTLNAQQVNSLETDRVTDTFMRRSGADSTSASVDNTSPPVVIFNLGENSWVTGKVERGQKLGGKLGFPTLNLDPSLLSSDVPHGVFAAEVEVADQIYYSAAHYGPRKTLDEWRPTLEFHLLDFDQHIPGHLVRFRLCKQIRETKKFDSLDQLKQQLAEDVVAVRKFFGN